MLQNRNILPILTVPCVLKKKKLIERVENDMIFTYLHIIVIYLH